MEEKEILINPFEDDLVKEPRRIEKAVSRLNDQPLNTLLRQFDELDKDPLPRKKSLDHAQLVISPDRGYGKSHLIGRLFHKLSQRATLVYLRPFEDAYTCWKSILLKIVQELRFSDKVGLEYENDEEPTQLEAFAHGILVHLLIDAVEGGVISVKNRETVLNFLRGATVEKFRKNKKWIRWVRDNYNGLLKQCSLQLHSKGIVLNASPFSWLGVLFTYAYFPSDFELRETCMDWLEGGSIDLDDAKRIGIRKKDIPGPEMTSGEINESCKYRILDFCQLAGFFRPFLFCFDQTDNYGKEIMLSKSFGTVIESLVAESHNQMTVVTANQKPWRENVTGWWDRAFLDRLSSPLELEGLDKAQAMELIEQRFKGLELEEKKVRFIEDGKWLDDLFPQGGDLSIRRFLQQCDARWRILIDGVVKVNLSISEYYEKYVRELKTKPKRHVFDPNILYWLIYEAASGLSDLVIEKYQSPKGYFSLVWKIKDWQILFGFESGSNGSRWQGITREAKLHYDADHHTKIVIFRTPELPAIPGPKWKKIGPVIEEAKKEYLHILILENDEIAKLYAAYDLYADTVEGNIDFKRHEVLSFIRDQLKPFWERIQTPFSNGVEPLSMSDPQSKVSKEHGVETLSMSDPQSKVSKEHGVETLSMSDPQSKVSKEHGVEPLSISDPQSKVSEELIAKIFNIVQQHKFMSVDDLMKKLPEPVPEGLIDKACVHIPEIKLYDGPNNMKVLQWQSTSEQSA